MKSYRKELFFHISERFGFENITVTLGQLDFGPWEQLFHGEFDGRRRKRARVKIIGE